MFINEFDCLVINMSITFEAASHCPLCAVSTIGTTDGYVTPFGKISLSAVDIVMDSSALTRTAISTINALNQQEDSPSLSALGLTTVFSFVGGTLAMHTGWHESNLMKRIGDVVGRILADLKCLRGGIQAAAGALFVPIRGLSIAASITASKSLANLSSVFSQIGSALFGLTGLLVGANAAVGIQEELSLLSELCEVYAKDPALDEEAKARACLAFLQNKLEISSEEEAEILKTVQADISLLSNEARMGKAEELIDTLLARKNSMLSRVLGEQCVSDILAGNMDAAPALIERVFSLNQQKVFTSILSLALCVLGIAATLIPIITSVPAAAIVAAGLNALTSVVWFGFDLNQLIQALRNAAPGKYDNFLLATLSLTCIVAVSLSLLLANGIVMDVVTGSLGLLWLIVNVVCLFRRSVLANQLAESDLPPPLEAALESDPQAFRSAV